MIFNRHYPEAGEGCSTLAQIFFGAFFFKGIYIWGKCQGRGGKVTAKRFGAVLKIFYGWIPFMDFFFIWANRPRGEGHANKFGALFQDFCHFRLSKNAGIWRKKSNVYGIFRGQQYFNLRCFVRFCKMLQFTRKKCSAIRECKNRGGSVQPIRTMPIFRLLYF